MESFKQLKERAVIPLDDPIRILVTKCIIWKIKTTFGGRLLGKKFEGTLATVASGLIPKPRGPKNDFYYKDKSGSIRGRPRWRYYNTEKPERIISSRDSNLKLEKRGNRRRVGLRDVDWEDHHDLRRRLHQRGKSINDRFARTVITLVALVKKHF
ncbi:hypothetical protein DERP_013054 [Dermatophagoides pteronyssinus]|uniref:Uncharacterized protein n=1 Tax=Dermatophagoides pteronyssinus TaxID=6956 RepID=A0ABQ8JQR9_DERPT|nr:hypothetical protein DERP_013054 [Dermatophagoides pteronyssinus]